MFSSAVVPIGTAACAQDGGVTRAVDHQAQVELEDENRQGKTSIRGQKSMEQEDLQHDRREKQQRAPEI